MLNESFWKYNLSCIVFNWEIQLVLEMLLQSCTVMNLFNQSLALPQVIKLFTDPASTINNLDIFLYSFHVGVNTSSPNTAEPGSTHLQDSNISCCVKLKGAFLCRFPLKMNLPPLMYFLTCSEEFPSCRCCCLAAIQQRVHTCLPNSCEEAQQASFSMS